MAEAERLPVEKRSIELEKGTVQIEINYRENVVADKQRIADALLRFESVVTNLPADDRKDLVQLIVREISVKHFDPSTEAVLKQPGVFKTRIRTRRFFA